MPTPGSPLSEFAWVVLAGAAVPKATQNIEIACRVRLLGADAAADANGSQHMSLDGLGMVNKILVGHALVYKVVQPDQRHPAQRFRKRGQTLEGSGDETRHPQKRGSRGRRYGCLHHSNSSELAARMLQTNSTWTDPISE